MKGSQITSKEKLVPYNTKVKVETKQLLAAVAQVQGLDGQRELLERMVVAYCERYPAVAASAQQLLDILGGIDAPEPPTDAK